MKQKIKVLPSTIRESDPLRIAFLRMKEGRGWTRAAVYTEALCSMMERENFSPVAAPEVSGD
jgi:hypothetical protein